MQRIFTATIAGMALTACTAETDDSTDQIIADGSVAEVVPDEPAAVQPDPAVTAWIAENYADSGVILYSVGEVDLDGDGQDEILAYVGGPMLCGTGGCLLEVLQRTGQGLDRLGSLSVSQLPVGVFEASTNGWRDLAVTVYGGGIEGGVARVPFGEGQYASNPTVEPAQMTKDTFETVIPDAPLQPLN
ncbi:hypothetical protein [Aurantiacibacter marinus]|uniref:hypothetical protein n=1 Tax=Aurantiacibacter marinus TaxID=874156 RepID=UPI000ACBC944|nr:hypothetical protein [Aurantiacibacter marinus]